MLKHLRETLKNREVLAETLAQVLDLTLTTNIMKQLINNIRYFSSTPEMRIPQILLCCCPRCKGQLLVQQTNFKDEPMEDPFIPVKYQKLVTRFGQEAIDQIMKQLNWEAKTAEEI